MVRCTTGLQSVVLYVYCTRYDALFKPSTPNLLSLYSTSAGAGALLAIVFISLGSHPRNSSGLFEKLLHGYERDNTDHLDGGELPTPGLSIRHGVLISISPTAIELWRGYPIR